MKTRIVVLLMFFVLSIPVSAQDEEAQPLMVTPAGRVIDIALAPDESTFITVSASVDRDGNVTDTNVQQWDTATGEELHSLTPTGNALHARYSPDGTLIGVGYSSGDISVHDAITLEEIILIAGAYGGEGNIFLFSPDNSILVGSQSAAVISSVEDGSLIATLEGVDGAFVTDIALSADQVITSDFDNNLNLHDAATGEIIEILITLEEIPEYLFQVDETHLLVGGRRQLDLLAVDTLTVTHSFGVEGTAMIFVSVYESRVAASTFDGQVVVWDTETGELVETVVEGLYRGPQDMALGASVLVAAGDGGVSVWTLENPLELETEE